jgi:1,5-rhamnosyltransferase
MKIFFLGWGSQYEKHFIEYLSGQHEVKRIPTSKWLRRLHRMTSRILGRKRGSDLVVGTYCQMKKFSDSDLLICNDNTIKSKVNPEIVKVFPGKKVMLVRNPVDASFVEKWRTGFDAIYSFDPEQCARLGMDYLNQFIPIGYKQQPAYAAPAEAKPEPTALFVGLDKGRAETLLHLASVLSSSNCKVDLRILADKTTRNSTPNHITSEIDFFELQEMTRRADVLIEINQLGQSGFTLRALEAAYYGKKLITNNQAIKETPLYHPNNVLLLDEMETWNVDMFRNFLALPLRPVGQEVLYKYSPDFMLESLMASHRVAA